MCTYLCVRLELGRGMAFLGAGSGAGPSLIEWQHLLQLGWARCKDRHGMCWPGIIVLIDIYWLDDGPVRPFWMITADA